MENAYVFAAFWLTGAVIGYIWQALSPRRLEERTLLWAGITLAVVVLMALTDGSPSELAESANQIVTMWGILCGLIERGASDVRRRRAT